MKNGWRDKDEFTSYINGAPLIFWRMLGLFVVCNELKAGIDYIPNKSKSEYSNSNYYGIQKKESNCYQKFSE